MSPVLELRVHPGVHALASVVSVLHARGVEIQELSYAARDDAATLVLRCGASVDVRRLAAQLERRLDVTAVVVRGERLAA